MDDDLSVHVVAPAGESRQRIAGALGERDPFVHDSVESFRREAEDTHCAVVVDADGIGRRQLLRLCAEVADGDRRWIVLVSEEGPEGELRFRPFSAGFGVSPEDLEAILSDTDGGAPLFELHEVLRFVAQIRHDINNPLTAGMAETQLLLMDVGEEGEVGEALQTIERQLRRIQALIQDLTRLRPPAPESG